MKKQIKTLLIAVLFCFALVPAVKSEAAPVTPAAPSGLGVYSQNKGSFYLDWTYDANLPYYSDVYPGYFGYEVVVTNLKDKKIATVDSDSTTFSVESDTKIAVLISSTKMKKAGFKFKVRSYVYDETMQKVYSEYSKEKVVIPRATIKSQKLNNGKVKITWEKVTGAKDYTLYLSSNNGQSFKKVGTTSKNSLTISKKLNRYKDYYVYVQANNVKYKKKKYNSTKPVMKDSNTSSFYIYTTYTYR